MVWCWSSGVQGKIVHQLREERGRDPGIAGIVEKALS